MLIKTIHELRIYLPEHAYREIETRAGIYTSSEESVLLPLLGTKLLRELNLYYASLPADALVPQFVHVDDGEAPSADVDVACPMARLVLRAQPCIVYDAEERDIDRKLVSLNNSGANIISADGYDPVSKDALKLAKDRLWKDKHEAVDRLLIYLEELALSLAPDSPEPPSEEHLEQAKQIVNLWRESRYFYLAEGLLINTATKMQEFVDIADNRERFVQMLPDMRFIQRNYLRTEMGAPLFDRLLAALQGGTLTDEEQDLVYQLQQLLALYTQQRSRVFKFDATERKRIEEECIGLKRELLRSLAEWRKTHNDDGTDREPEQESRPHPHHDDCSDCCGVDGSRSMCEGGYWGDKGSVFVMPGLI